MTFCASAVTAIIYSLIYVTDYGIVTGWGRLTEKGTLPHILQMVRLPFIATSECQQMYRHLGYMEYLHECQICSGCEKGGGDSCQVNILSLN